MMKQIKVLEAGLEMPLGTGGLEVMIWKWYENIDHDKIITDFMSESSSDDSYMKYMADNNSNFFLLKKNRNKILKIINKYRFIRKIVRENNYDIVHIHATNAWGAFQFYIAAKAYCSRIIIHSHNGGVGTDSAKMNLKGKIIIILHKICRCLIRGKKVVRLSCSKSAARWMFPEKSKYLIIKNGIKISDFVFDEKIRSCVRRELGIEDKFVIGHVGRLSYAKNHDFLIDVFEAVHKKNPDSVLLLVGGGKLEDHIKERVHNAGLDGNVIFHGATDNVCRLYQAMDCFVFPSHFEGLGVAAIEAQTAGLYTLCSDGVPVETKITDFLEYMTLSETAEKWAEKILSYNNGYERRNMSEIVKKAGYDIKSTARQLEELYLNK